jgi:hypothetical protein
MKRKTEGESPLRRTVTVALGDFSLEFLGGTHKHDPDTLAGSLMQAVRYYLADKDSGRAEWSYPSFQRDGQVGERVEVEIHSDDAVWEAFSAEAERQGVSTDQLLQHAVLYFAADLDAGRLTQRILDDLT